MRFYTEQHQHYCGIDLHARTLYLCILDAEGNVLLHKNLPCDRARFLEAIDSFRDDLVVASECIFNWYWLADLCAEHAIPFVLGRALYMRLATLTGEHNFFTRYENAEVVAKGIQAAMARREQESGETSPADIQDDQRID